MNPFCLVFVLFVLPNCWQDVNDQQQINICGTGLFWGVWSSRLKFETGQRQWIEVFSSLVQPLLRCSFLSLSFPWLWSQVRELRELGHLGPSLAGQYPLGNGQVENSWRLKCYQHQQTLPLFQHSNLCLVHIGKAAFKKPGNKNTFRTSIGIIYMLCWHSRDHNQRTSVIPSSHPGMLSLSQWIFPHGVKLYERIHWEGILDRFRC